MPRAESRSVADPRRTAAGKEQEPRHSITAVKTRGMRVSQCAFRKHLPEPPCRLQEHSLGEDTKSLFWAWHASCHPDQRMCSRPSPPTRLVFRRRPEALPWFARIAITLAVIALVALWGWLRNAESRALAGIDPDLRGELFRRSLADAEAICARPELEDECRSRLNFLARFPECDSNCQALVARHRLHPVR